MTYHFNDFEVGTEQKFLYSNEKVPVPKKIEYGKLKDYEWEYKKREVTIFDYVRYKDELVVDDVFEFIDLIEILKGVVANRLNPKKTYSFNGFKARLAQKDKVHYIRLTFNENELFLDKFEASSLAAKFSKILSRCEAFDAKSW